MTRFPCVPKMTEDPIPDRRSPPPAKRGRHTDGSSRKVTFNPNVQERALRPANEPPPKPVSLKEAADIVVRYLDPFYTQGKFATKVSSVMFQKVGLLVAATLSRFAVCVGAVQVLRSIPVSPAGRAEESRKSTR